MDRWPDGQLFLYVYTKIGKYKYMNIRENSCPFVQVSTKEKNTKTRFSREKVAGKWKW